MSGPVFLVGARRSGTTLFRLMLDGHPDVLWTRGWEPVAEAIARFESGSGEPRQVSLPDFGSFPATDKLDLKTKLDQGVARQLSEQGKRVFGATVHVGFTALPGLWESAKFIHLVRDPRDIAISFMVLGWVGHYYFAADAWTEAERDWDKLAGKLSKEQYIELRYEDLIENPKAELTRVCEFLGVEFTDDLFNYVKTSKYGLPRKDLAYRWKQKLKESEVQLIESRVGSFMTTRGYEATTNPTTYSAMQVAWFSFANSWKQRLRRVRATGLFFVLTQRVARLLDWKFLNARVERWETEKHKEHLAKLEKNY